MTEYNNTIGVHALVWTGRIDTDAMSEAARRSAMAGYGLLELSLHQLDDMDLDACRAVFAEAGLQIACSRGLAPDADVSSEDPRIVSHGVDLLRQSVEGTAKMGGHVLTGALYSAFGKANRPLTTVGRANVVSALRDVSAYAASLGVTLGLEVCNRYETNVVNTARQALALADDIGSDNVMIHLDTYHMNIEESNLWTPVLEVGDRLGYVHIGENNRGLLGSGSISFNTFFAALDHVGYDGAVTFESFSSAIVSPRLSNDLAIWRNLWDDNTQLATLAREFIEGHLQSSRVATEHA